MNPEEDPWTTLPRWFPEIAEEAWEGLAAYAELLREWNAKINLVSRKDTERIEIKHLAHCLIATKFLRLMPKASLLDVGTGGGLPGIPLAICYPAANFTLIDSIAKKIVAVEDMVARLGLKNVTIIRGRAEELPAKRSYDFILGRAVGDLSIFYRRVRNKVRKGSQHAPANGILYWKGGDFSEELAASRLSPARIWDLAEHLPEAGLEEKYLVHFKI
ncbi:MAG: 16S rRNA (guanine(527)-N(7))-methyltransferase RsmG [Opitutales bacterium]|nr:16S rRNA (guanine(527)-N(7))-methyltransferase RsmG [Opitutales bacterium]